MPVTGERRAACRGTRLPGGARSWPADAALSREARRPGSPGVRAAPGIPALGGGMSGRELRRRAPPLMPDLFLGDLRADLDAHRPLGGRSMSVPKTLHIGRPYMLCAPARDRRPGGQACCRATGGAGRRGGAGVGGEMREGGGSR